MRRTRTLNLAFAIAATALFCVRCEAQRNTESANPSYAAKPVPADSSGAAYTTRPVPATRTAAPFSLDASPSTSARSIEYRTENQMTAEDRDLAAAAEPSIRNRAALSGIDFDRGKWSYEQLVCQALPDHVFLIFHENTGVSDQRSSPPRFRAAAMRTYASYPSSDEAIRCFLPLPSTRWQFLHSTTCAPAGPQVKLPIGSQSPCATPR